jgi:hypothetical protein
MFISFILAGHWELENKTIVIYSIKSIGSILFLKNDLKKFADKTVTSIPFKGMIGNDLMSTV